MLIQLSEDEQQFLREYLKRDINKLSQQWRDLVAASAEYNNRQEIDRFLNATGGKLNILNRILRRLENEVA